MPPAIRSLLRSSANRWAIISIAIALFAVFSIFDLRSGGMERNFAFGNLADPRWTVEEFGALWFTSGVVLNVGLALGTATLMVLALTQLRHRRNVAVCSTSAVAPVVVGFGAFTCPPCIVPVTGLIGSSLVASSLPLLGLEFKIAALAFVVAALVWAGRSGQAPAMGIPADVEGASLRQA